MFRKKCLVFPLFIIGFLLLLNACGEVATVAPATIVQPTQTPYIVVVTATPQPATVTPLATPTTVPIILPTVEAKATVAAVNLTTSSQPLITLSGSGTKSSQKFNAANEWSLNWSYDCSSFGSQGNFIIYVYNSDGSLSFENSGVSQLGTKGSDTNFYHKGGTFYLSIISECSWKVNATNNAGVSTNSSVTTSSSLNANAGFTAFLKQCGELQEVTITGAFKDAFESGISELKNNKYANHYLAGADYSTDVPVTAESCLNEYVSKSGYTISYTNNTDGGKTIVLKPASVAKGNLIYILSIVNLAVSKITRGDSSSNILVVTEVEI